MFKSSLDRIIKYTPIYEFTRTYMSPLTQYKISPALVSEHFDNEVIIVNMTRGHYYSLRGVAAVIWQGIEAGLTTNALLQDLVVRYAVEAIDVQQSLNYFLLQLVEESLILEGEATTRNPLPVSTARDPFVAPLLEIYTDMADLLALDPIHDVSPVEGWPIKRA